MRMDLLFLTGFKAVEIAEEVSGLEEIYLLQLIGREKPHCQYIFKFHKLIINRP
jgi:hypothetical protein